MACYTALKLRDFVTMTQKSVAVVGTEEFPKLLCLNVKNTCSSESLIPFC